MARPAPKPSLYDRAGTIRHLDAARARRLVDAFRRPVVFDGVSLRRNVDDPAIADAWGRVTLNRVAVDHALQDVVAYAKTHLHLHGLLRLPLSVARELVEHRGHLYLDRLTSITDSVAATLAGHVGAAGVRPSVHLRLLSFRGLAHTQSLGQIQFITGFGR